MPIDTPGRQGGRNKPSHRQTYDAAGFLVSANLYFPELPVTCGEADLLFEMVEQLPPQAEEMEYRVTPSKQESEWCRFFTSSRSYRVRYKDGVSFLVDKSGRSVHCTKDNENVTADTVRHLFLHHMLPFVGSLVGRLFFHACAVEIDGRAIAFAGNSGAGKSTTALAFAQRGYKLLSDDMLPLEDRAGTLFALPSFPYIRITEDSIEPMGLAEGEIHDHSDALDKRRLAESANRKFVKAPLPLAAVYFLVERPSQTITISPLHPADALIQFQQSTVMLEVRERSVLATQFQRLAGIVERIPMYALRFPRDFAAIPTLISTVVQHQKETHAAF